MNRVLSIPELLRTVFTFSDSECNSNNILVCKQWSEICMDELWYEVDDFHRLAQLLAPVSTAFEDYCFTRIPTTKDWQRFESYARRVRYLDFRCIFDEDGTLCDSWWDILDNMARSRPTINILPNLQSLRWCAYNNRGIMEHSVMFMHENVRSFVFEPGHCNDGVPISSVDSYLEVARTRMPKLAHLRLQLPTSISLQESMIDLIKHLPNLQSIDFPSFVDLDMSNVMKELSLLRHLDKIVFQGDKSPARGEEDPQMLFDGELEQDSFPALQHLELRTVDYWFVKTLIRDCSSLSNLSVLRLTSRKPERPYDVQSLVAALAQSSPHLSELRLGFQTAGAAQPQPPAGEIIKFSHIEPLLPCADLRIFEISALYPVDIDVAQITLLASGWPLLEVFVLNKDPVYFQKGEALPLSALLPFAQHCPRLHTLGLYMRADAAGVPHHDEDHEPFRQLCSLQVGSSHVEDGISTAIFLSQICPPGCVIDANRKYVAILSEIMGTGSFTNWQKVSGALPSLRSLRAQTAEKLDRVTQRLKEAERELVVLRGRAGQ